MSSEDQSSKKKPLFRDFDATDDIPEITEIESLCLSCNENGTTKVLLTKIPFYKEIILMSFSCPHCGFSNNETQFGGKIQDTGVKIKVKVQNSKDLNRQVVRSDFAVIIIPELDFEIPSLARKGEVTTIEGIINRTLNSLESEQPIRKVEDPSAAAKIEAFLERLHECKDLRKTFHFVLNDPSGNSFVENPFAPQRDDAMVIEHYKRSVEDNQTIGLVEDEETVKNDNDIDEVMSFPTNCPECNSPCETNMKVTEIPHFKEVVIMATTCESCGHRTNEVKSGSGIETLGVKFELELTDPSDMTRDVLKSETCSISIPELEFEVGPGTIGGKFTTLEGLLQDIKSQLLENNPFVKGDSAEDSVTQKLSDFGGKLDQVIACKMKAHVIFDDPAGNSYIQNFFAPEPDPALKVINYERNFQQNDELGINDMKTENY